MTYFAHNVWRVMRYWIEMQMNTMILLANTHIITPSCMHALHGHYIHVVHEATKYSPSALSPDCSNITVASSVLTSSISTTSGSPSPPKLERLSKMESVELHARASECVSDFNALLMVEPPVGIHHNGDDLTSEEQLARFSIWAANIGIFADGHASLDYRLRDSWEAKKLMLDLLGSLKNYLRRATDTVRDSDDADGLLNPSARSQETINTGSQQILSASSILTSSYQASVTDDSISISVDQDRTPFEQRLHGVEQTIDRLYRLSVAIRKPSIINQNTKAATFLIRDEEGNDVSRQFEEFALAWITHTFQEASVFLRERLARSITLRRRRFMFRQHHQKKLGIKAVLNPPARPERPACVDLDTESTAVARTIVDTSIQKVEFKQKSLLKPALASQTSASRVHGKFRTEDVFRPTTSRAPTEFSGTIVQQEAIGISDPPKAVAGSKEFECPYCCMMLPMKEAMRSNWVRHVLNDLEPYVCVFEDCSDAHRLFWDRAAWLSHMQDTHTRQWTCRAPGHKVIIFETEDGFEDHIRLDHANGFKESQLPWYKKRSQDSLLNNTGSHSSQKQNRSKIVSEDVGKHLARHLQAISMKALPWQEDVEEESSEKEASKHADEGHKSNDDLESHLAGDLITLAVHNDESDAVHDIAWQFVDPAAADCGIILKPCATYESYQAEWGFMPQAEYYGHDRDPILQKLLRRLYLDSSSTTEPHSDLVLPVYMMPPTPLNKNFFGRKNTLKAIATELIPETNTIPADGKAITYPLSFAICAPGGMGKTQVAIQFARKYQDAFDVILWVNADSANEMAQGFQKIARVLGLIPEGSIDANDLVHTRELVKRWLVKPSLRDSYDISQQQISWLLIYDGVQDPDILNDFWPYDGPGSVLITSRNPFSWTKSLPLKQFTAEEAVAFLLRLTNRELSNVDRKSVSNVSSRLGGLPLALTQMASIIVTKQLSFSQFFDSYNERESQRELLRFKDNLSLSHEHTVASVWAFENLKYGRKLLNVLSMLDPDSIPERLLTNAISGINLPGYPTTANEYEHAKRELLACSLVTGNKQESKLFIHRLVQDVARAEMGQSEFRQTFVACVKLVASIWPFEDFTWRHGVARWPICEEVFPHISRLKDIFPAIHPSAETSDDYHFARLLTDTGWYLHERGRLVDTNLYNNMAQSICESLKCQLDVPSDVGPSHGVTHAELDYTLAELYHNRGVIACGSSDSMEGLRNLKIFHDMMEKQFNKETPRTDMRLGLACNELGFAYMLKEDWAQGEVYFQRSIELLQQLDEYEPVLISLPMVNLGYAYWLQGRLSDAADVLEKGVSDREEKYGIQDRISFISGRFYHALGNVMYDQGSAEESLSYHHKALLHYKATLGNNHHLTASVFVKVAEHNIRVCQYDTAVALLDHAFKVYSMSKSYLSERARVSFKRSQALKGLGRFEDAGKELRKCFQVYEEQVVERVAVTGKKRTVKSKAEDLTDRDFDDLVAFWFK
ncbi:hypothetical protein ONS96_009843 [Cadophora gregata f. sp. sojae]|nr:hypothetical protein ONS96_009843 [Cadophora gregata f. sp. sojae]